MGLKTMSLGSLGVCVMMSTSLGLKKCQMRQKQQRLRPTHGAVYIEDRRSGSRKMRRLGMVRCRVTSEGGGR